MNWYKKAQKINFYHGTSSNKLPSIKRDGLNNSFLADSIEKAEYYAKETVEVFGGEVVVLLVDVANYNILRYDPYAMDEPVMADTRKRNYYWNKAAKEHPEWVEDDAISIPKEEWEISWNAVGSVKFEGIIPWNDIKKQHELV